MNYQENRKRLLANPETSNYCTKWTPEEELDLLNEVEEKMSIEEIALKHKRTKGGIRSHLLLLAREFVTEQGLSLKEVSELVNLSENEIRTSIEKSIRSKEAKKLDKKEPIVKDDKYMEILVEIRDLLKIIAEK